MLDVRTLTDGGQTAEEIGEALVSFLGEARRSLDIAIYDVRLPGPVGDHVVETLRQVADRGVRVRLIYNVDGVRRLPLPPPPQTVPDLIEALPFKTVAIPGEPDLMHHKYVVRDHQAIWTGSTNWTLDSWTREENLVATVQSAQLAAAFTRDFEELLARRIVERSGYGKPTQVGVDGTPMRAWFCPGHGPALSTRIAGAIAHAQRRVRIASPVLTAAAILGALGEAVSDGRIDIAGVLDATQVAQVFDQWQANGNVSWKAPLLHHVLDDGNFSGKRSTPYRPGSVHDYMHAKITVADDTVFLGSFNLSHSGEMNAENVLEVEDADLAERLAAYIDGVRARYPDPVSARP